MPKWTRNKIFGDRFDKNKCKMHGAAQKTRQASRRHTSSSSSAAHRFFPCSHSFRRFRRLQRKWFRSMTMHFAAIVSSIDEYLWMRFPRSAFAHTSIAEASSMTSRSFHDVPTEHDEICRLNNICCRILHSRVCHISLSAFKSFALTFCGAWIARELFLSFIWYFIGAAANAPACPEHDAKRRDLTIASVE